MQNKMVQRDAQIKKSTLRVWEMELKYRFIYFFSSSFANNKKCHCKLLATRGKKSAAINILNETYKVMKSLQCVYIEPSIQPRHNDELEAAQFCQCAQNVD